MPLAPSLRDAPAPPRVAALPVARWAALVTLLVAELVVLMLRFDTDSLRRAGQPWWADEFWRWKFVLPPLAIAISTGAILVGGDRLRVALRGAAAVAGAERPWRFLIAHLVGFAIFARLTAAVLEGGFATATVRWPWIVAWFGCALATLACWALCAFPPRLLAALTRRTAPLLLAGVVTGAAAWTAGLWTETWWDPLRATTIAVVGALVRLMAPDAVVDAPRLVVGTDRFAVRVLTECAGYEGIGLVWVFLSAYLWAFRRTLRFPRALLLIPIGTAAVWLANALRLTVLIAIGTWVSPAIAVGGFHTYSGALLFSAVALGLVFAVQRSPFFTVGVPARVARRDDATAAYLVPFLVLVATGLVSGALSSDGFEAAYPLRVIATGAALWAFQRAWRVRLTPSSAAVGYGLVAFALWMALAAGAGGPADDLGRALHALPPTAAALWLAFRIVGAVAIAPIAEELAFRGYLMRRIVAALRGPVDFEDVPLRAVDWPGIVVSSLLFGAMHRQLVAGTLVGVLYALSARERGRLGDAIVAHATTNALIAAYVLATGSWALWA